MFENIINTNLINNQRINNILITLCEPVTSHTTERRSIIDKWNYVYSISMFTFSSTSLCLKV